MSYSNFCITLRALRGVPNLWFRFHTLLCILSVKQWDVGMCYVLSSSHTLLFTSMSAESFSAQPQLPTEVCSCL